MKFEPKARRQAIDWVGGQVGQVRKSKKGVEGGVDVKDMVVDSGKIITFHTKLV